MPDQTPVLAFPFPLPSDSVVDYPALGRDLAETLETLLTTGDLNLTTLTTLHGIMLDKADQGDCLYFGSDFQDWLRRASNGQELESSVNLTARTASQYLAKIGYVLGSAAGITFGTPQGATIYLSAPSQLTLWNGDANGWVTLYGLFQTPARDFAAVVPAECLVDAPDPPQREDADAPPLAPGGPAVDLGKCCDYLLGRVADLEARLETLEAKG